MSDQEDADIRRAGVLAMQDKLPVVSMRVVDDGLALHAEGEGPFPWKATCDDSHQLRVWVGDGLPMICNVTVHPTPGVENISDDIQHIATAIVLSGLRGCAVRAEARRRDELEPPKEGET